MSARVLVSNLMAGGLIGVINITVAISVAALMFSGTDPHYFAVGVAILLVGTVVTALGGTLGSGFPGVVVAPRSGLAPVFAGLVGAIIGTMASEGQGEAILPTIVVAIMATTLFAGAILVLLGYLKLGSLVRYIPYPVMGGFFAGIGFIFVQGGMAVASGETVSFANVTALMTADVLRRTAPALIFGMCLYVARRRWDHWMVFPLLLVLGFGFFHVALGIAGQTMEVAAANGWLPTVSGGGVALPLFDFSQLSLVDWSVVAAQAGSIATVAILSAIILLLDISGIEIITGRELDPDRELKVAGFTNLMNGLASGYPGVHVASDTAVTYKLGGDGRLMGFAYAGVVSLAIAAGTGFIGAIPTFILGGLLIYVGIDFLVDWAWRTREDLPLHDYLVIVVILGVIATVGILEGVAFGFAVAIVLFVITYSRLSVIKSEANGGEHASHVDRNLERRKILNREGQRIWIMKLQGFIFFGTADKLLATVKDRLASRANRTRVQYLVLDFRHVSQLDTSAVQVFSKLVQLSDKEGVHIVVTEITARARARLQSIGFFTDVGASVQRREFDQLDAGVAWCEDDILLNLGDPANSAGVTLESLLAQLLGSPRAARKLFPFFESVEVNSGDYLFRQGQAGDCLYIVHSATAAVVIHFDTGQERIVRIFQEGAILGEMALYTGAPRSASVRIEEGGTLFKLDAAQMAEMQRLYPDATGLFHSFVVRLMAERLDRANKELQRYA